MNLKDLIKSRFRSKPSVEYSGLDSMHLAAYGRFHNEPKTDEAVLEGICRDINKRIKSEAELGNFRYEYKINPHYQKHVSSIFNHYTEIGYKCFMMNEDTMPGSGINSIMITWYG